MASARFRVDVNGSASAAAALRGASVGAYLTWRISDSEFVLSYVAPGGLISHTRVGRNADGSFCLPDAREVRSRAEIDVDFGEAAAARSATYPTLSKLVATRMYVSGDACDEAAAGRAALASSAAVVAAPTSEIAPVYAAEVPTSLRPPPLQLFGPVAGDTACDDHDDDLMRLNGPLVARATAACASVHVTLTLCVLGAGFVALKAWLLHSATAAQSAAVAAAAAAAGAGTATLALTRALAAVPDGGLRTMGVEACEAAAWEWREAVSVASARPQSIAPLPGALMMPQLGGAAVAALVALVVISLLKAPQQRHARTGELYPLPRGDYAYRPRVLRSLARLVSLVVFVASVAAAGAQLWALGAVPDAVEVAARPFAAASAAPSRPPGRRGPAPSLLPLDSGAVAAALDEGRLPFSPRERGAAAKALRLAPACAAAVHVIVGAVADRGVATLHATPNELVPTWLLQGSGLNAALDRLCAAPPAALGGEPSVLVELSRSAPMSLVLPPLPAPLRGFVACGPSGPVLPLPSHRAAAGLVVVNAAALFAFLAALKLLRTIASALVWNAGLLGAPRRHAKAD